MTGRVVVVGSANLDLIADLPAIPAPGETVLSRGREDRSGGKGLNQAVAAARAGTPTTLVGAVGSDDAAGVLVGDATEAGVDTSLLRRVEGASGTAWILVRPDGENAIVVDGAANRTVTSLTDRERRAVEDAAVVVAQLEMPMTVVVEAARLARRFVLNAAPAQPLDDDLLREVDVLVVNEHEARTLTGRDEPRAAAAELLGLVGAVVVTLGADGALLADRDDPRPRRVAGVRAEVVDTTGAGDTFTGYLAASLAAGSDLDAACRRAVVAGALATETAGAVPSVPAADRVDERLTEQRAR